MNFMSGYQYIARALALVASAAGDRGKLLRCWPRTQQVVLVTMDLVTWLHPDVTEARC